MKNVQLCLSLYNAIDTQNFGTACYVVCNIYLIGVEERQFFHLSTG